MSEVPTTSGIPPETVPPPPPKKLLGKKLFLVIGLIAIVAVASVFALMYLMPKGLGAPVSLGMNYSEGEIMTYDADITISAMGRTVTQSGTIKLEILDFDGVNYTIRETVSSDSQQVSFTIKMNKTGHIIDFSNLPPEVQQTFSSFVGTPGFGGYFPRTMARVGESWQIPLDIHAGGFSMEGTGSYGISGITSITIPAGTYTVFRMDITAANIHGTYSSEGTTVSMVASMSAYVYMENATCVPVEISVQESATVSYSGQTVGMSMTILIRLKEHTK